MEEKENIDFSELEKFSSRADHWWDTRGEFKTLHDINPARLGFITRHVSIQDLRVLDIGCGGGILAEAMVKQGAIVTAIDASKENISIASQHASVNDLKINYFVDNAETFSENHIDTFDLITCMELLVHVPDPVSIIQACSKMIDSGGHVIFSTINRNIKAYILAVVASEYFFKLLPRGTHRYEKFIRPSELANWCNKYNLEVNDLAGMHYNPLLSRCTINEHPDVNYLLDTISIK